MPWRTGWVSHNAKYYSDPYFSRGRSLGRRLDGDAVFPGDGRQLPDLRRACRGGRVKFGEHLIEAAARRAQDQDTRGLIADIADGMSPATGAEDEAARRDATGRGLAFEFNEELAAQDVEGFVLPGMRMTEGVRPTPLKNKGYFLMHGVVLHA
jgi:hypothetical protein